MESRRVADGSVRMKAVGGPYHGMYFRWYPPFDEDEPIKVGKEVYYPRQGEEGRWSTWHWVHNQEESNG